MSNAHLNASTMWRILFTGLLVCACGGNDSSTEGESEAEGEAEVGDDQCPPEGCETEERCANDSDCPDDDPCRIYTCDQGVARCRYQWLDQDGDGFRPEGCDGRDCNDDPDDPLAASINEGAAEICDGIDQDCDKVADNGIDQDTCENEQGQCGYLTCQGASGWSDCQTPGLVGLDRCDPIAQTGCPEDNPACYLFNTHTDNSQEFICTCEAGKGLHGDPCESRLDCTPGYICVAGNCNKLCRQGHDEDCPEGRGCRWFSGGTDPREIAILSCDP